MLEEGCRNEVIRNGSTLFINIETEEHDSDHRLPEPFIPSTFHVSDCPYGFE
jgi:hypothetical protein